MTRERRADRAAAIAAAVFLLGSVAVVAALEARPRDGADVAAVFPPWMSGDGAISRVLRAGGVVVREGVLDTILVVHGGDPRLIPRLYAAGAWAVIDPVAFGGCLVASPR